VKLVRSKNLSCSISIYRSIPGTRRTEMRTDERLFVSLPTILDEDYAFIDLCSNLRTTTTGKKEPFEGSTPSCAHADVKNDHVVKRVRSRSFGSKLHASVLPSECIASEYPRARRPAKHLKSNCVHSEMQEIMLNLVLHITPWILCFIWMVSEWINMNAVAGTALM
jgi:hypothetical protein